MAWLETVARHGKWCLVLGLVAGLALPALAVALKPALPALIAVLLFLAAFRIGPDAVFGSLRAAGATLRLALVYQLAVPLVAFAGLALAGLAQTAPALALILMLSAPSVTGSPNFAILMGRAPDAALRMLMIGTALFPLTAIPVLLLLPALGLAGALAGTARLAVVVLAAAGAAFTFRRLAVPHLTQRHRARLDGAAALFLGVIVIGLMSETGPLLTQQPGRFLLWLGFAFCANFGAQIAAWYSLGHGMPPQDRAGLCIIAGNRNIALFLVALPPALTDPLLVFIGCYQFPMYLTPILLRQFYNR